MEPDGFRLHVNAIFPHTADKKAINSHLTYYACNFQFTTVTLDSTLFQFSSKDSTDVNFFYNNFTVEIIFTTGIFSCF